MGFQLPRFRIIRFALLGGFLLSLSLGCEKKPIAIPRHFSAPDGFVVDEVASGELVGSTIKFTFDETGTPIVSPENSDPLALIDADGDGRYEKAIPISAGISHAQGLWAESAEHLLVTADGPEGGGLYRLTRRDRASRKQDGSAQDGISTAPILLARFDHGMSAHGAHSILPGPDGDLYILFGNAAQPAVTPAPDSPVRSMRSGVVLPAIGEPLGADHDFLPTGGKIYRVDRGFKKWSLIAWGLRNPYDFAIDRDGGVITVDSDSEYHLGMPWYRPNRFLQIFPGADYGWRPGSGELPTRFIDIAPAARELERGSPSGMTFYHHDVYPERYRGALFVGDWSRGKIQVYPMRREGSSIAVEVEEFVTGQPLNVTDLETGPDGCVYFTTGGRGTRGGLYRIRYVGPAVAKTPETDIRMILDGPMPLSAWSRKSVDEARSRLGEEWPRRLSDALIEKATPEPRRLRALSELVLSGSAPSPELINALCADPAPSAREMAMRLIGLGKLDGREHLTAALGDPDPGVRRGACEALAQSPGGPAAPAELNRLLELLNDEDRILRAAARRALLRVDPSIWVPRVLGEEDPSTRPRAALEGLLAILDSAGAPDRLEVVEQKLLECLDQPLSGELQMDVLRILEIVLLADPEVAIHRPGYAERLGQKLLARFSSMDALAKREATVILARLRTPGAIPVMLDYLETRELPREEQIQTVYALRAIPSGWNTQEKTRLLAWFERARKFEGADASDASIHFLWEAVLELLTPEEKAEAQKRWDEVTQAERWKAAGRLVPGDAEAVRWRTDLAGMSDRELKNFFESDPVSFQGDIGRGQKVFERQKCVLCHAFGRNGGRGGPDLTSVVGRLSRTEILESILYPSRVVSDQFRGQILDLEGGETATGLLLSESERSVFLLTPTGAQQTINRSRVRQKRDSTVSIMPEGFRESMYLHDMIDLFAYLSSPP